ncbi:MAG: CapA family protein [Acidothermus cellulolyticus]|nr:CapA family protein [Acidothermus cellulolyticus]MBX5447667.1 CapA family protein [Acidothermus cellulolyticus]
MRTAVALPIMTVVLVSACSLGNHATRPPEPPNPAGRGVTSVVPTTAAGSPTGNVASATAPTANSPADDLPTVEIAAVGDLTLGNTPRLPPNAAGYLASVRSALAAPIVFANLEGALTNSAATKCPTPTPSPSPSSSTSPMSAPPRASKPTITRSPSASGTPQTTASPSPRACFAFRMPPDFAASVLKSSGFTVLNSANNHSHDFGPSGVADTSAALKAAGIAQTGLPGQFALVSANGIRVAFIGFAPYDTTNDMRKGAAAQSLITLARAQADIVVVYMHAGAEGTRAAHVTGTEEYYLGEDRGNARAFAHAAIDAGADLVIGSGPHVLRGMEYYRGKLIAYSLGDFAGYYTFATNGTLALSGILHVRLDRAGRLVGGRFISTHLDAAGRPTLDPTGRAAAFINGLSRQDFGVAAAVINPDGTLAMPQRR